MSLDLTCDECGDVYFTWIHNREQKIPPHLNLWRRHICSDCQVAMDEAVRGLSGWAGNEKDRLSGEYDRRLKEEFDKHRRNRK